MTTRPNIFASYHREAFETALVKAEINDAAMYTLWHTFASHLVMSGVDLVTVLKFLGHATIPMTMRYSHLSPEHQAKAVGVLDNVLGRKNQQMVPSGCF